jgi:peptidoglycan/LPS O-acetylase OafA/YrhL
MRRLGREEHRGEVVPYRELAGNSEAKPDQPEVSTLGAEIRHSVPPLNALTSIRFFAAIHVVIYHLNVGQYFPNAPLFDNFVASGYTGVTLFFILSGFILAYNYDRMKSPKDFWISRFARIYPVYLLALLVGFAFTFLPRTPHPNHIAVRFVASLSLLQAWYGPFASSFNAPAWTLSVEAFFYALFPFLLVGIRRTGRRLFVSLCFVYLAILCIPLVLMRLPAIHSAGRPLAAFLNTTTFPIVHLPVFLIGIYMGRSYLRRTGPRSLWPLLLGIVGSLALLVVNLPEQYLQVRRGLLVLSYSALVYGLASVRRGPLTNRWMLLAGEISYSVYILQMLVFRVSLGITRRYKASPLVSVSLAIISLIAISYLSYRFIELPARLKIRSRLTHRPVPLTRI